MPANANLPPEAIIDMPVSLPPDELKHRVAQIMAIALYRAKLSWLPGEKIVARDLEGAATFMIGALAGMKQAENASN